VLFKCGWGIVKRLRRLPGANWKLEIRNERKLETGKQKLEKGEEKVKRKTQVPTTNLGHPPCRFEL
jgi:hypothetical protein